MRNHQHHEAAGEAHHNFFQSFGPIEQEACDNLRNCAYEMQHFSMAAAKGALETAEKRIQKDPMGVAKEVGVAVAGGLVLGAVAEISVPAAVIIGGTGAVGYALETLNPKTHAHRNEVLGKAWNAAWNCKDETKVKPYFERVAKEVGPQVFDFTVCTVAGGAAGKFAGTKARAIETIPSTPEGPRDNMLPLPTHEPIVLEALRIPSDTLKARVLNVRHDGQFARLGEEGR